MVQKTWTFHEGDWHEGNIASSPRTHAMWLARRYSTARAPSKA